MSSRPLRPVSTRHAFALAFDLAFRRDPLHSLVVPFLLMVPWLGAVMVMPAPVRGATTPAFLVSTAASFGGLLSWLLITAMLRFRARSVFNQPPGVPPAPALDCYTAAMRRVGWLFVTEVARTLVLLVGLSIFVVPYVYFGHRLAFATEAVVLTEPGTPQAFRHSFRLSSRRFERWLEMMVVSVLVGLVGVFLGTLVTLAFSVQVAVNFVALLLVFVWPLFQYAWTFFYLRLIEVEEPQVIEVGPAYAALPPGTGAAP